jgi:hypothetical protein
VIGSPAAVCTLFKVHPQCQSRRAGGNKATPGADLPKIEGKILSQKGG